MQGSEFDEIAFFSAIDKSGARALLIGRRALVLLGIPVLTADYDLWLHVDDVERLNTAVQPFDLFPNRSPEEALEAGRYVLENDEHVDVLVARAKSTANGETVTFDEVWKNRVAVELETDARVFVPTIDDLIRTKLFAARPKDLDDIQLLEALKKGSVP